MTTEKMIEVMKAYTKGEPIECKMILGEDNWGDVIDNPSWDWLNYEYRIKSENKEPTYRPYKNIEEMYEDIKKRLDENYGGMQHPVFSGMWLKQKDYDMMTQITGTLNDSSLDHQEILLGQVWIRLEKAFNDYTFLDGTPFGIKVE
ncbi:MAG: hypothetical protein MJZ34_10445 [Paludibacteraceae bacterium]|nr:hypothetical protein [Paludibacteraceae bacterium]